MNQLPSLERLKQRAKDLLRDAKAGDPAAISRMADAPELRLAHAQWVIARELGYPSWPKLREAVLVSQWIDQDDAKLAEILEKLALGHGYEWARRSHAQILANLRPDLAQFNLGIACLMSSSPAVEAHLATGASISEGTPPPLCLAAGGLGDSDEVVRLLLASGADPNQYWEPKEFPGAKLRPLYYAAGVANSTSRVKLLLEAGADPNDGESLYHACEHENPEVLELLVNHGALWSSNELLRALDYESPERLATALRLGARLDAGLRPALHHALLRGRSPQMLEMLLDAGASPGEKDKEGRTAVQRAAQYGDRAALELFASRGYAFEGSPRAQAFLAAATGDRETAFRLKDELGHLGSQELAMLAELASLKRLEGVRLLLDLGWPVKAKGGGLGSALNEAAFQGDPAMAQLLLDHGATWDEKNTYGGDVWGSVGWASRNIGEGDHVGVARVLLEAGSPLPQHVYGSEAVEQFLADWLEDHPDHPRVE